MSPSEREKKKRGLLHKTAARGVRELAVFPKNIMIQLITVNPMMQSVFDKRCPAADLSDCSSFRCGALVVSMLEFRSGGET